MANFQKVKNVHFDHISDQELLEKFYSDHDNTWIGILLQRYTLLLLGVCMKYLRNEEEAKDAVQQIFLKTITELNKYKVEYFKSWLYMVTKNHCLMKLRENHGKLFTEIHDSNVPVVEEDGSRQLLIEKEKNLQRMSDCLEALNAEQNQCVILFYLEKKTYQQIAGETGFTLMQVKSHIQNGKRNLKILMEKK